MKYPYYFWTKGQVPKPITTEEYLSVWSEDRLVERTTYSSHVISTVFLLVDHNYNLTGPSILFETMIFKGNSFEDIYCERYSTEQEAIEGHQKAIIWLKENIVDKYQDMILDIDI